MLHSEGITSHLQFMLRENISNESKAQSMFLRRDMSTFWSTQDMFVSLTHMQLHNITYEFIGSNQTTVEESNLGQAHRILDSARKLSMTRVHHGNFINFRLAMQEFLTIYIIKNSVEIKYTNLREFWVRSQYHWKTLDQYWCIRVVL